MNKTGMACSICKGPSTVLETRHLDNDQVIKRRRRCPKCMVDWTTMEFKTSDPKLVMQRAPKGGRKKIGEEDPDPVPVRGSNLSR